MKSIQILIAISVLLSSTGSKAQIKNAVTESVMIYGIGEHCESTIEKVGYIKNVAEVDWDRDSKLATLTFDADKTNKNEILKSIALAGFDSDQFLAPDDVYAKLPESCQYNRVNKSNTANTEIMKDHTMHSQEGKETKSTAQEMNHLKAVFDNYFALKDALVKSDGTLASTKANELSASIAQVKMNELTDTEHTVWMKVMKELVVDTENIEKIKEVEIQRSHFDTLSENMYLLLKVSKQDSAVYYQHCPMANSGKGANWLSKENAIKNPYYGSSMLTCGKTVEKIEK